MKLIAWVDPTIRQELAVYSAKDLCTMVREARKLETASEDDIPWGLFRDLARKIFRPGASYFETDFDSAYAAVMAEAASRWIERYPEEG